MIVAGIGCRRGTDALDIEAVLTAALGVFGIEDGALVALATESSKRCEPGIVAVAARRGVPLRFVDVTELDQVDDRIITRSLRVAAAKGTPSIAEAAALVIAGPNARLLGARISNAVATCAIAIGEKS